MIGVGVTTRNNYAAIQRRIDRRKAELLTSFATDLISIAGQSLKNSSGTSRPGDPPFVHSGAPNLRTMRYRIQGDSVMISPVRIGGSTGRSVPDILERGGQMIQRRKVSGRRGGYRTIRYYVQARPYVRPSAEKAMKRLIGNVNRKGLA